MRNNILKEIKKSEKRTEKRMVELIEKKGTEGKQLEEVKMELINEGLKEIWKEKFKETEIRMCLKKSMQG